MANLSNINNKLLVGTNGEVRIGDTATVADVKLRVKQTAQQWTAQFVNTDSSVAYGISIDTSASSYGAAGTLQCYTNSGGGFVVRNDSKVGIGETSPLGKLHVKTTDTGVTTPSAQGNLLVLEDSENGLSILSSTAGAGYINFGDSDDNNIGMIIYGHSSNSMDFWTNAGKRMTIDSSGNLLLNQATSRIKGGGSTTGRLELSNSDSKSYMMITGSARTSDPNLIYFVNDAAVTLTLNANNSATFAGDVGIGVTPNASYSKLQIKTPTSSYGFDLIGRDAGSNSESQITFWNSAQSSVLAAIFNITDNLYFTTGTTERMVITNSGNVGIGTITPIGKTDIFVGASGYTNNVTTLPVGTWSFANGSGGSSYPTLVSKSNATGAGMTLVAATDNGAPNGMDFNIREGDNTDFSTLTTSGFTFSRFGTVLTTILPSKKLEVVGDIGTRADNKIGWVYNPGTDNAMYNYLKTALDSGTASSHIEISGANWTSGNTASVKFTHVTGGDLMTIMTGGNVGIGYTSPGSQLSIYKTAFGGDTAGSGGTLDFGVGSTKYWQFRLDSSSSGDLAIDKTYANVWTTPITIQRSSGNVGIGTASPDLGAVAGTRVLTIASPTAERWGILELAGNRTWGGNQVGELKFISTDSTNNGTLVSLTAINDPTATGTGGSLKFNTRQSGGSLTERMRIADDGGIFVSPGSGSYGLSMNDTNQVMNSGYINGNQTVSLTYTCTSMSSMFIECVFNHYGYVGSYGCARVATFAVGPVITIQNILEVTSPNGGSWTFNRVSNTEFTVVKTAGTYAGGGRWFVKINGARVFAA
jgi:hypothetical protein